MPGLHIIHQNNLPQESLNRAGDDLIYKDGYKITEFIVQKNMAVIFSGYDGYPVKQFDTDNFSIVQEGLIYNQTDTETESVLIEIVSDFLNRRDYKSRLKKFIESADGEFLIYIRFKKKNKSLIFNDRWGKLPVFHLADNGIFALSREIKFILHFLPQISFNRMTMAEFLVYEYNFGQKTLINGIQRLSPASLIEVEYSSDKIYADIEILKTVDLSDRSGGYSRKEMIDQCVGLFRESLQNRINKLAERNLAVTADLSGGFDTRVVFAGLCNLGVDFIACHDSIITGSEIDIAGQVAETFGKNLLCFEAPHLVDDIAQLSRLTYLTDGLINCRTTTACWYDDLERERIIKGKHANFMGFGGEPIRHPLKPKSGYAGLYEMLIDDAFSNFLRISDAARILGISDDDFSMNIKSEIDKYPEADIDDKLKHLFFDLHDKQVKGGENRHRVFHWTVQPLWGNDLFDFEIHNIPLKMIDDDFFADFAAAIDPRILKVPIYGRSYRLGNSVGRWRSAFERKLTEIFRDNRRLFKMVDSYRRRREETRDFPVSKMKLWEALLDKLTESPVLSSYFDISAVRYFMEKCRHEKELYQILTLIFYIDEIAVRFPDRVI